MPHKRKKHDSPFSCETDIKQITAENGFYRRVLYTGPHSRLVLMSIPPEGETAEQDREDTDTMLFIVRGKAKSILNKRTRDAWKHDVIFVPAGSLHDLRNTGRLTDEPWSSTLGQRTRRTKTLFRVNGEVRSKTL